MALEKTEIAIMLVEEIGRQRAKKFAPLLVKLIAKISDGTLRNKVALCLSDLKADDAVGLLISLAKDKHNKNNRGTLIYALNGLDYYSHLDEITAFIIDGNYETQEMAYMLFKKGYKKINEATKEKIILKLESVKSKSIKTQGKDKQEVIYYIDKCLKLIKPV